MPQIKSTIRWNDNKAESVAYWDWDVFGTDQAGNEAHVKALLELPAIDTVTLEADGVFWVYEIFQP